MAFDAPAYSQTLEQQEQKNRLESLMDKLQTRIDSVVKARRVQCMSAIANERLCECLGQKLPWVINFVQYVAIVTQTREELKYNTLSAEDKQIVDDTRKARDECLSGAR